MMGTRIEMPVVRAGDVLKMMRSYFHINLLRNRNKLSRAQNPFNLFALIILLLTHNL